MALIQISIIMLCSSELSEQDYRWGDYFLELMNCFASRSSILRDVRDPVPAGGGAELKNDLCALRVHLLSVGQ